MRLETRRLIRRLAPPGTLRLLEGFWTVPLALAVVGVAAAAAVVLAPESWAFEVGTTAFALVDPTGARMALSAIAGGVMTIVTLVFSLTFVALSITAQLLSPRVMDHVLRQRALQVLIGLGLATFLFSTITLAYASEVGTWRFAFAVPVALLLSGATLAMVVLFAHTMTRVMRLEDMVVRLGEAYLAAIGRMLEGPEGVRAVREPGRIRMAEAELASGLRIDAEEGGYVGLIDHAGLVELARERGLRIGLLVGENAHVLPGMALARVIGAHRSDEVAEALRARLSMVQRREASVWGDYEAQALSEAALRALSPSLNDPATALSCINLLFLGIARMAGGQGPPHAFGDDTGEVRLVAHGLGVMGLLESAVLPIAVAGRDDYRIVRRLAELTRHLATIMQDRSLTQALLGFAARIEALAELPGPVALPR